MGVLEDARREWELDVQEEAARLIRRGILPHDAERIAVEHVATIRKMRAKAEDRAQVLAARKGGAK